jgi:hypothetical protein
MKAALPRPLGRGILIIQNLGFSPIWALIVAKAKGLVSMIPRPEGRGNSNYKFLRNFS